MTTIIADLKQRRVTFTKRRKTLLKKASDLSQLTGARTTVVVRSTEGKTYYGSYPSGKEIISKNTCRKGKVISPTGLSECEEDWVEKECDSCTMKEDFESVIAKYEACGVHARKRLEDWENKPSIKASAGGDSGVKVDYDTEILPDKEINSLLEAPFHSLELLSSSAPSLWALCKDSVNHGDCDSFRTSPVNSAAGGASNPTCSGFDGCEFNPDDLLNLSEHCIGDSDCLENSAVGGGDNPDFFVGLGDLDVSLDIGDFLVDVSGRVIAQDSLRNSIE
ncbi:hypothetical protein ACJRO7_009809 [Eucalyptus globulus]|uniref:MADS-box domain-containing protein n=1 Tax=Eucalyptus globulus TaxID=34317 RepID=A0ABD3LAT6_EUCGL